MGKVPTYNLRAINKYNSKFDRIAVNLPEGSKEKIKRLTGKSCNKFMYDLAVEELERLESQQENAKAGSKESNIHTVQIEDAQELDLSAYPKREKTEAERLKDNEEFQALIAEKQAEMQRAQQEKEEEKKRIKEQEAKELQDRIIKMYENLEAEKEREREEAE